MIYETTFYINKTRKNVKYLFMAGLKLGRKLYRIVKRSWVQTKSVALSLQRLPLALNANSKPICFSWLILRLLTEFECQTQAQFPSQLID